MKDPHIQVSAPSLDDLLRLHLAAATQRNRLRRLGDTAALLLASEAQLRRRELQYLRWSDIDFDTRTIRVPAGMGRVDTVRITPSLATLLARFRKLTPKREWVFSNGIRPASPHVFEVMLWRVGKAAGLRPGGTVTRVRFHDLRQAQAASRGAQIAEHTYLVLRPRTA